MKSRSIAAMATLIIILGCAGENPGTDETSPAETSETIETSSPIDLSDPATMTEGFSTPESVLWDAEQDVYFVSNINGAPLDADDNGYISKIDAAERMMTEKWIDGTAEGIDLSAPKGMAILGDELWVTDIDHIRRFDKVSGEPRGSIPIEGSTFLNDLATSDGVVYASDSGLSPQFESTGTDQVYAVSPEGSIEKLALDSSELGSPNGVAVVDGEVWVVTFSSNELYRLSEGRKTDVVTLPTGGLDGLTTTPGGELIISSWGGKSIYRGLPSGPFTAIFEGLTSPADIGLDSSRNLLLVPIFEENRIEIRPLPGAAASD